MRIFITGGTGLVGGAVTELLTRQGHGVTLMQRHAAAPGAGNGTVRLVAADGMVPGPWQDDMAGHDAVINLAGASIFSRWTKGNMKLMYESRVLTTRNIVNAVTRSGNRVTRLVSASAVGYYGARGDEKLDEGAGPGNDFLSRLTRDWEAEAVKAELHGVTVAMARFGIVLSSAGGALGKLLPLFGRGLGSPLGSGRQWFSWIHHGDLAAALVYLLENPGVTGPVNCTAPGSVTNRELTRILASVMKRPAFLPAVPSFVLKLALGEFASVLLEGQRVAPSRLLAEGFSFAHPDLEDALRDLLAR